MQSGARRRQARRAARLERSSHEVGGPFRLRKGSLAVVAMSGIEAHVLHADDFLALVLGDGVPDGHVIGGQVQLVGAGQRVIARERVREGRDRLVQQVKDALLVAVLTG
jgi:hypothetical protein